MELINSNSEIIKDFFQSMERMLDGISRLAKENKPHLNGEKFLSNRDAAKCLKVSIRTLQEWRDTGVIPYIQIKGNASGDGLRLCPFQDTKRSFGDALQRSKKGRTGGGFSQIRQGTASMRFHRMLFCRVRGCLMFDIGCADICVAYPDFGGRFWLVSVDSLQRIRRNYRGSGRLFSPGL